MKVIYTRIFPDESLEHNKMYEILKKYMEYKHCSQSQAVIDLILNSEEYINRLCNEREPEIMKKIREFEQRDAYDLPFPVHKEANNLPFPIHDESDYINIFEKN